MGAEYDISNVPPSAVPIYAVRHGAAGGAEPGCDNDQPGRTGVVAFVYTAMTNLITASVQEDNNAALARKVNGDNDVSRSPPQTTKTLSWR